MVRNSRPTVDSGGCGCCILLVLVVLALIATWSFTVGAQTVRYRGRWYSGPVCNSRFCSMCNQIRTLQAKQRQNVVISPKGQQRVVTRQKSRVTIPSTTLATPNPVVVRPKPTVEPLAASVTQPNPEQAVLPHSVVTDVLAALQLTKRDVFCDVGCGDGRLLIAAVRRYRCKAIGVEIDPSVAKQAIKNIVQAELDGLIPKERANVIVQDAKDFNPVLYGVTAGSAFLFPNTLKELKGILIKIPRLAVPFHQIPNHEHVDKYREVFIYRHYLGMDPVDQRFQQLFGSN